MAITTAQIRNQLLCFIALILACIPSLADKNLVLTLDQDHYTLGPYLEYLQDPHGQWTYAEVSSPPLVDHFKDHNDTVFSVGFTDVTYWLRIKIFHPTQENSDKTTWLLELGYPLLDQVELYYLDAANHLSIHKTGDHLPFAQREVQHHSFVFPVGIQPGQTQTLYLRIQTEGSLQIPLTLWSPIAFSEQVSHEQLGLGFYYGIMLAMVGYNLFLFLSIRDRSYLYYILYITCSALTQFSLHGLAYAYLWPDQPWWANHSIPFFLGLTSFWALQFSRSFLDTATRGPILDMILHSTGQKISF